MGEIEDFSKKSFKPVDFVQQLANNVLDKYKHKETLTNIGILEIEFKKSTSTLKVLSAKCEKERFIAEKTYNEEKESFMKHTTRCQNILTECQDILTGLSERMNSVMNKVVPIGIQLEILNTRICRTVGAHKLMTYPSHFLEDETTFLDIFKDTKDVQEIANTIQKLHIIAQELPSNRFSEMKKKIESKYDQIERSLIQEFVDAQCIDSLNRMKTIIKIMSGFKGYSHCLDAFIEQSQQDIFPDENVFTIIIPICEKNFKIISEVFQDAEQVKSKFLLSMYDLKIRNYSNSILSRAKDDEEYLRNLTILYTGTNELSDMILRRGLTKNKFYLDALTENIFRTHLESYIRVELRNLKEKYDTILQNYYDSIGHQKKTIPNRSFQEFKRELQAAIGARTNISSIAQVVDCDGKTFLLYDVAISLFQKFEHALKRCSLLSDVNNQHSNTMQLFEMLLQYLIGEIVTYAINLGIQSIPMPEVKRQQSRVTCFFRLIREVTSVVQLLNKQLEDAIIPSIRSEGNLQEFLEQKETVLLEIELKLDTGIDRCLNAVISWIKIYLQNERKKSNFRSDTIIQSVVASDTCKYIISYIHNVIRDVRECLDSVNLENVLMELAGRFHRVIYEHLLQYNYNEAGALQVICDVNEYRKFMKHLNFAIIDKVFDTLYALCNLLLVRPNNLEDVCGDETLAILEDSVLLGFIQLRSDFKTLQLPASFKQQS